MLTKSLCRRRPRCQWRIDVDGTFLADASVAGDLDDGSASVAGNLDVTGALDVDGGTFLPLPCRRRPRC